MDITLKEKNILVLSPQAWGKMFLSKHHYPLELAKRGNKVYFLNPPVVATYKFTKEFINVTRSDADENLWLIDHSLPFPYFTKYKFPGLYSLLVRSHIKKIIATVKEPIDIVWSFDLGNLYPLKHFGKRSLKIFQPVDEPRDAMALAAATGADVMFSVTPEILEKYRSTNIPQHIIDHGVATAFLEVSAPQGKSGIDVGMSGNFLRPDIDRPVLLKIISAHPEITFHCWGSYQKAQSNIAGSDDKETQGFINQLSTSSNVKMYGAVEYKTLAKEFSKVDAFLICYNVNLDQSNGTNYHKIMEYLCTGKVIVSNNVTAYKDHPTLVTMVNERDSNEKLPALFTKVINDLKEYNAPGMMQERIQYASGNTYSKQVGRIEGYLQAL